MRVLKNIHAEEIIKLIIPKRILDLNPVIAGGFVVSLYYDVIRHSSPKFDKDILAKIRYNGPGGCGNLLYAFNHKRNFEDIDLWFLKDNGIWLEDSEDFFLIKDYDPDLQDQSQEGPAPGVLIEPKLAEYGLSNYRTSFSDCANSWYCANSYLTDGTDGIAKTEDGKVKIQFVKNKYKNISDLFSEFDLVNCCSAYYDGKFYFHDDFEDAIDRHTLEAGRTFFKSSVADQIFSALRAFKYSERFSLQFSEEICDYITTTMFDAISLKNKLSISKNILGEIELEVSGRKTMASKRRISHMAANLMGKFEILTKMEEFKEDNFFLFLNSDNRWIDSVVKSFIERETYLFRKKLKPNECRILS